MEVRMERLPPLPWSLSCILYQADPNESIHIVVYQMKLAQELYVAEATA